MKNCKYCKIEFQPRSNRQVVCDSKICKNKLHTEKIKRYRKSNKYKERQLKNQIKHQKTIIYSIVKKQKYVNLYEIINKSQFKPEIARRSIKILAKERKIYQSFDNYHISYEKNYSLKSHHYSLNGYKIIVPAYINFNSRFLTFLNKSGIKITKENKIIGPKEIQTRIRICQNAYASIWSEQLAIKLYDQFILARNKGFKHFDSAIGFFLHYYKNLARCLLTPDGYENWKVPSFTDNITVDLIKLLSKKMLETEKNDEKHQPKITRKDVTDLLKQIHNNLNTQVEAIPINKNNKDWIEDLKLLLTDLIQFSNDIRICERIYYAISKTIEVYGEPFLPIKQSKTLSKKRID